MSFSRFLDAAYALLHDEYGRLGEALPMATERLSSWAESARKAKTPVASANDDALAALKARLAGVQGAPKAA